LFNVHSLQ